MQLSDQLWEVSAQFFSPQSWSQGSLNRWRQRIRLSIIISFQTPTMLALNMLSSDCIATWGSMGSLLFAMRLLQLFVALWPLATLIVTCFYSNLLLECFFSSTTIIWTNHRWRRCDRHHRRLLPLLGDLMGLSLYKRKIQVKSVVSLLWLSPSLSQELQSGTSFRNFILA